eukprot:871990-Pleurochrysis_carterae.AAC.2
MARARWLDAATAAGKGGMRCFRSFAQEGLIRRIAPAAAEASTAEARAEDSTTQKERARRNRETQVFAGLEIPVLDALLAVRVLEQRADCEDPARATQQLQLARRHVRHREPARGSRTRARAEPSKRALACIADRVFVTRGDSGWSICTGG